MRRSMRDPPPARPQRSTRASPPTKRPLSITRLVLRKHSHTKPVNAVIADKANDFDSLPPEIMQEILMLLDDDQDLCYFQLSCQYADAVVKNGHFWGRRFKQHFDSPRIGSFITSTQDFEDQYKKRKTILRNKPAFRNGEGRREVQCLAVLKDLIMDACSDQKPSNCATYTSKNIEHHISTFLIDSNLLSDVFARRSTMPNIKYKDVYQSGPTPLMRMLQVLLAPSFLDPRPYGPGGAPSIYDFQTSQYMAYSSIRQQPIFGGCNGVDVNFTWALHNLNFWRNHMLLPEETTLNQSYKLLADNERPQFWCTQLKHNHADYIGKRWKGAYAFVHEDELLQIRAGEGTHEHIQDEFNGEESTGDFQDLNLELTGSDGEAWSPVFESVLRALAPPPSKARTRAQKASSPPPEMTKSRSFRFGGGGEDAEEVFLADGWFNPLGPQHGVPGWQRMTMMKYFVEEDTGEIDYAALWAYEGVVLPGGKIVLGRWWSPTNAVDGEHYSGPFILWCVDDKGKEAKGELA